MNIAIISTPFASVPPDRYGGTELFIYEIVQQMVKRGHKVTLYATGDSSVQADLIFRYDKYIYENSLLIEFNHYSFSISDILKKNNFDIIHINSPLTFFFTKKMAIPSIATLHHIQSDGTSSIYQNNLNTHYVAISNSQKKKEPLCKIMSMVHHGLNLERYPFSLNKGEYLAFLGRMDKQKGAHVAIHVSEKACIPIRMAGKLPTNDPVFYQYLNGLLSLSHVEWIGEANHAEKVSLLQGATALLFPIDWDEPFGLVVIEAMLCGTPVIGFNRGSVPELIDEGITGFVVESEEEMLHVIREKLPGFDRKRCREMAEKRFSSTVMADKYEQIYHEVMNGAKENIYMQSELQSFDQKSSIKKNITKEKSRLLRESAKALFQYRDGLRWGRRFLLRSIVLRPFWGKTWLYIFRSFLPSKYFLKSFHISGFAEESVCEVIDPKAILGAFYED